MKPIITKFNNKTGDFEIIIPVPFTERDVLGHTKEVALNIPKYEYIEHYNIFDLIREKQELIDYLKEKIRKGNEDKEFWLRKNELEAHDIREAERSTYEEILSKIEKR